MARWAGVRSDIDKARVLLLVRLAELGLCEVDTNETKPGVTTEHNAGIKRQALCLRRLRGHRRRRR
jgi:hypothetical protein